MKTHYQHSLRYINTLLIFVLASINTLAQVWNKEAIDSTGTNNGVYCSLKMDHNNKPHVAYMDADYSDLKYATKKNNTWQITILDSLRYTGVSCDMDIDNNNTAHICFQAGCQMAFPCPNSGVMYMTQTENAWIKEIVDPIFIMTGATDQTQCNLELNMQDQPILAYINISTIKLAYKKDGSWTIIDCPESKAAMNLNLQLKADGSPVIQYFTRDSLHVALYNMAQNKWSKYSTPGYNITATAFKQVKSMIIDSKDALHIIYPSLTATSMPCFKYVFFDWDNWQEEIYYSGIGPIALCDDTPSFLNINSGDLILSTRQGENWLDEMIDENAGATWGDLDYDKNKKAHIALYSDPKELSAEKTGALFYYSFYAGSPNISISNLQYHFGDVWTESYLNGFIYVRNKGIAPLILNNIGFDNTVPFELFGVSQIAYIAPGDSLKINFRFTPTQAISYSELLKFNTNDPTAPLLQISISGNGITTGNSAKLHLLVNNVFIDIEHLILNDTKALEGVHVEISKNEQNILNTITTPKDGYAIFNSLSPDTYEIKLRKTIDHPQHPIEITSSQIITIGPGANSHTMTLPDSLYHYKYVLIDSLNRIEKSNSMLTEEYFTYRNAETEVDTQLCEWAQNYNPNRTECLARLILVESMAKDLYKTGIRASSEMFRDYGDLFGFILYSDDWSMSIIEFFKIVVKTSLSILEGGGAGAKELFMELMDILQREIIKQAIFASITEGIELIGAELGHPANLYLMDGWQDLRSQYSSLPKLSFGSIAWDETSALVSKYLRGPFIQMAYINTLTVPVITKSLNYTVANNVNGSFTRAYRHKIEFVANEMSTIEDKSANAANLREAANLCMITAQILNEVSTLDISGVSSFVNYLGSFMKVSAYVDVLIALGISTNAFFLLPSDMEDAVNEIHFAETEVQSQLLQSKNKNITYAPSANQKILKQQLESHINSYDSVLLVIKDKIDQNDRLEAVFELYNLIDFEKRLKSATRQSYIPICALADTASTSIAQFSVMYDSLIWYKAQADQERLLSYLNIVSVIEDSTDQEKALIKAQIDLNMVCNHNLSEHINRLKDSTSNHFNIPAAIMVSLLDQNTHDLEILDTGIITIRIKNVGDQTAHNLWVKILHNDALSVLEADSLLIEQLDPGQESNDLQFTCQLISQNFTQGNWEIVTTCDDARTFSSSGFFRIQDNNTFLERSLKKENKKIFCSPNPIQNSGTIYYQIDEASTIDINLYDLTGRKIKTLFYGKHKKGIYSLTWNTADIQKGYYILTLHGNGNKKLSTQIIVRH